MVFELPFVFVDLGPTLSEVTHYREQVNVLYGKVDGTSDIEATSMDCGVSWEMFNLPSYITISNILWESRKTLATNIPCDLFDGGTSTCIGTRFGPWQGIFKPKILQDAIIIYALIFVIVCSHGLFYHGTLAFRIK